MMTPAQCRAARALLDWSPERLAKAADREPDEIGRFEAGEPVDAARIGPALQLALEDAGVAFPDGGVRLASASREAPHELHEVGPESEVRGGSQASGETLR